MFKKYPDQSRDRWQAFWIGAGAAVISGGCILLRWNEFGFMFFAVALTFIPATLFCNHAAFETAKRVWKFLSGFA